MSTQKVAIKHLILFMPGVLSFQVEGFDDPEVFPNISEKILSADLNTVKQFIEKNYLGQGFTAFVKIAKLNFGIEATEKLTPQIWNDAVTSFKCGKGSIKLQVEANAGEVLDPKRSYTSAVALVNTVTNFAKYLEPEYFADCESIEDFIALLPAAVEEVAAAVETAQEGPAIEAATEVPVTAPEQVAAPVVTAKDPLVEKPANVKAPTTAVVTAPEPEETSQVGLRAVIQAFDTQDAALELAENRLDELVKNITETRTDIIKEIRTANKGVRAALVDAITGQTPIEVGELAAENV